MASKSLPARILEQTCADRSSARIRVAVPTLLDLQAILAEPCVALERPEDEETCRTFIEEWELTQRNPGATCSDGPATLETSGDPGVGL